MPAVSGCDAHGRRGSSMLRRRLQISHGFVRDIFILIYPPDQEKSRVKNLFFRVLPWIPWPLNMLF